MAIATLDIQLNARLGELQSGMDRAVRIAEKSTRQIEAKFSGLKVAATGIGGALGAAFSTQAIAQLFRSTINSIDALNDLAAATGSSVEKLSALEDIAVRGGTSLDAAAGLVMKLNKALADAKPGTELAGVFDGLGLSVKELKALDPAEALLRISKALAIYADEGNKARTIQRLFGESSKDAAKYLQDLAEAGQLNGTVTNKQAEATKRFNDQVADISKNVTDAARAIVTDMLPALAEWSEKLVQLAGGPKASDTIRVELETLRRQRDQLQGLQGEGYTVFGFFGSEAERTAELLKIEAQIKQAEAAYFRLSDRAGAGRGFVNPRLVMPDLLGGVAKDDGDAAARKRLAERARLAGLIADAEEQAARESAEAWQAWERIQLAGHKATTDAWALQWQQVFDEIDAEQDRAILEGAALLVAAKAEEISEFAREAGRNIQDALGDTVLQTLEGDFDNIGKAWLNMLKRMAAQAIAADLAEKLLGKGYGSTTSQMGGWLSQLGKLFGGGGGASTPYDVIPAGVPLAKGMDYVPFDGFPAILHKGERVVTAAENRAPRTIYNVNVAGDASENTIALINAALAQYEARQMGRV